MKTFSTICCTLVLAAMATKLATAVPPGLDGIIVDMDVIIDLFAMAGLPAKSVTDWATKMTVEIRGIIGAKLYAMARVDGIDPDTDRTEFAYWLGNTLLGKKILALYGFSGNTLADLCASIYIYEIYGVSVDIWITEPEFIASNKAFPAGDVTIQIFNMMNQNPFIGNDKNGNPKEIKFLNVSAVGNYKNLADPSTQVPRPAIADIKENYLDAVRLLKPIGEDPSPSDINDYINIDRTHPQLKAATDAFFENCDKEVQKAKTVSADVQDIIDTIKMYHLVTEAAVGASSSNGDFKLTLIPTLGIALAAQGIVRNGFNILLTNDNPAMGLSATGVGMHWMYRRFNIVPLQPSFNVHMGPLKKGVLYSDDYRKILHICIMPDLLEDAFIKHKILKSLLAEGGVAWKYNIAGDITPKTHLANGLQKLDSLAHPVKLIRVAKPDKTKNPITEKFTMSQNYKHPLDRPQFMKELTGLFLNGFDIGKAISSGTPL